MKKILTLSLAAVLAVLLCACGGNSGATAGQSSGRQPHPPSQQETKMPKIKITVNGTVLTAVLENNATARAIVQKLPLTLPMRDLYAREMCYHFGANALPTGNLRSDGYAVGDIIYWPPQGSFVILYEQNGERFERQHLGHIASGVEIFKHTGDVQVKLEIMTE